MALNQHLSTPVFVKRTSSVAVGLVSSYDQSGSLRALVLEAVVLPSIAYNYIFLVRNPILVSDKRGDYETFT